MSAYPFGPLSPEEFQKAVDAPFGQAGDILRKADPLWGRAFPEGEQRRWKVRLRQQVSMEAVQYVEAASEDEAWAIAENIDTSKLKVSCRTAGLLYGGAPGQMDRGGCR